MNVIYSLLIAGIFLFPFQQGVPYAKISVAFEQKNASDIISCAKEKILITIQGNEGAYSRSQAILILKNFFNSTPDGTFSYIFKSPDSEVGCFAIGNYSCASEKYRITMRFKGIQDHFRIENLTIEKQ